MLQIIKPDFYIKIGIKEGKIVEIEWRDFYLKNADKKSLKVKEKIQRKLKRLW